MIKRFNMKYVITQDIDLFSAHWDGGLTFTKEKDPSDIQYFESEERLENVDYFKRKKISYTEVIKFGLDNT